MSSATVWTLQDGSFVAYWFGVPDSWGWYSESGELLEHLNEAEARYKIISQQGVVRTQ